MNFYPFPIAWLHTKLSPNSVGTSASGAMFRSSDQMKCCVWNAYLIIYGGRQRLRLSFLFGCVLVKNFSREVSAFFTAHDMGNNFIDVQRDQPKQGSVISAPAFESIRIQLLDRQQSASSFPHGWTDWRATIFFQQKQVMQSHANSLFGWPLFFYFVQPIHDI